MTINFAQRMSWIMDFRSQTVEIEDYYPRNPINFGSDFELIDEETDNAWMYDNFQD